MFEDVEKFLKKYNLLNPDNTYLVGFSGGFDSMCLLHILSQFELKLVAVHLNHNWRGAESDLEEQNCKRFCEQRGIQFYCEKLDSSVKKTETAARDARQEFFKKCYEKYNAKGIFLAHTKSDNAETVIYRLIKGTGVRGLSGISEYSSINGCEIFRPLMNFLRADVENYCSEYKLNPNDDSSNRCLKYKRNFIRHKILPVMKEINPSVEDKIYNLSQVALSEERIVNEYLNYLEKQVKSGEKFLTQNFLRLSVDVQKKFIMNLLIENGIDYDSKRIDEVIGFIQENADCASGKTFSLNHNLFLMVSKSCFYPVVYIEKSAAEIEISGCGEYEFCDYKLTVQKFEGKFEGYPSESEKWAYTGPLPFPICLRYRCDGDLINPFGMSGSMKLKKFFINKNIPKPLRNGIILLCKNNEVLWAAGCCLSNKLRCVDRPEYIIKLEKR